MAKNIPAFHKKADLRDESPLELVQDEATIRRIVASLFNGPAEISREQLGTLHLVYRVSTEDAVYFAKVFKGARESVSLGAEARILTLLGHLPYIPAMVDCRFQGGRIAYLLTRSVAGENLRQLPLDSRDYPRIIENLGGALRQVHDLTAPFDAKGFGLVDEGALCEAGDLKGDFPGWHEYVLFNLEQHVDFCINSGVISEAMADGIHREFANAEDALRKRKHRSLLHGDPGSHNFFYDENLAISGIIDWEDATLGDPLLEIAHWATFFRMTDFLDSFNQGYYAAESDRREPDWHHLFWIYFLRLALAKGVLRIKLGLDQPGPTVATEKMEFALGQLK